MQNKKISFISHKTLLYIASLLFLALITTIFLEISFPFSLFNPIVTSILFLLIILVILYFNINIINPLKSLDYQSKKTNLKLLSDISIDKEDRIDAPAFVIEKSIETIIELSNSIKNATLFIEEIEKGKLDATYQESIDSGLDDTLSKSLLSMRDQMLIVAESDKQRSWTREGITQFGDILRITGQSFEDFYDNILRSIVKYINANQGGLYLVEQEKHVDSHLELVSYYAFERKKYLTKRFEITEGLIGQCYLEKDIIFLKDVPKKYSLITSGTGEAVPNCVLILPLKTNDIVYGILELASLHVFEKYQIDFLKRLGENIAATISNTRISERTRKLLEESQMQAEQMRNQEEELLQNMEELHATQEEMERGEKIHLEEINRLQKLHEENLKQAQLKNEELKKAENETKNLMIEIQASQEEITKNYQILFEKFNAFNIETKFDQLTSIRSTKKRNIEDYFNTIRSQIMTYSEDKMIVDAMKSFKSIFPELGKNILDKDLEMMKINVVEYYENEFLPRLNANSDDTEKLEKYWDNDPRTIFMQYQYISNNKNETGKKHLLNAGNKENEYSKIHSIYHPIIRNFLLTFGYYDIFLIDNETGHIVYSVFKEVDYTTSLLTGPYKNTNFAQVFREARNANKKEFIKLVDFEPYDPSYTAPASFIATPIFEGDVKIGVLVFQMPIDKINSIMTGDKKWTEDGLGASGETYLVGEDYKMRSISRFLIEDPVGYFNELERIGYNQNMIRKIKRLNTTILLQDVKTEAVIEALRGNQDKKIVLDYRDISVLSAYAKLDIQDVNWVICSDIDEKEVVESISNMKKLALN